MEELFEVFIVIIALIGSLISTVKKSQRRRVAEAARQTAPVPSAPAAKKEPHPYAPAVQTMMPPLSFADTPGQVIVPTVHTHVQPDCDTHDAPGSLGVASPEGKDPCHEEQMLQRPAFTEPEQDRSSLAFDWSGDSMVKAFVMQEVLTRPVQRRAR